TSINYDGAKMPPHLSLTGFESWAGAHPDVAICDLPYNEPISVNVPCGSGPGGPFVNGPPPPGGNVQSTPAEITAQAVQVAHEDYSEYKTLFLYPSISLMVETGLWIELEATIGF